MFERGTMQAPPPYTRSDLVAELEAARSDLGAAVAAVEDLISIRMSWRCRIKAHPRLAVGAAFALGRWLGRRG